MIAVSIFGISFWLRCDNSVPYTHVKFHVSEGQLYTGNLQMNQGKVETLEIKAQLAVLLPQSWIGV